MGQFTSNLLSSIGDFVFAIIILILALIVASVAKSLVLKALSALRFEEKLSKLGVEDSSTKNVLSYIGKLVWFVVFLLFLPGVFSRLGLSSITAPITNLVSSFFSYVPNILAAVIIIAVGVFAADLVRQILVPVLKATKLDKLQKSLGVKTELSTLIADIVKYLLVLFFTVQAINALELSVLSSVGSRIISYVPAVIVSIIIVIVAILAGKALENVITKAVPKAKSAAFIAKIIVYVFAGFMVLSQLGFSSYIINTAFTLILAAVCLASAIAFGVGGRDFAKHQLDKLEKKIDEK